jgi:hypothetical protein
MTQRAIVVTLVLTLVGAAGTVIGILSELGAGGVLFLAILGGAIAWLLPQAFAFALPAGTFGGVLLTRAGHSAGVPADDDSMRELVRLAVLALVLSTLTVGWLVPMASVEASRPFSRYQDSPAEPRETNPSTLALDVLLAQAGSVPEARQELVRRAVRIAPSFVMPLFGGVLVILRPRWTFKAAVAATLAAFVISVCVFFQTAF